MLLELIATMATTMASPLAAEPGGLVFVNFDGAELTGTDRFAEDDAPSNTSWLYEGKFEPYGKDPARRAAVMQALRADWAAYDVQLTDVRPSSGQYAMSVVTPTNPETANIIGYAPVDCWDETTHANVTFAFHGADDGYTTNAQATTISQELAHSFGLEHVESSNDIMNPQFGGGDPSFTDGCAPLVGTSFCGDQHQEFCPAGQQNSHAELMAIFGPSRGDYTSPMATIASPVYGEMFATGSNVTVELSISSLASFDAITLVVDGEEMGPPTSAQPFTWTLDSVQFGVHELYVVTRDASGTESTTPSVRIGVDVDPLAVEALGERGDRYEESLSCSVGTRGPAPWMLLLLALGLVRRGSSTYRLR